MTNLTADAGNLGAVSGARRTIGAECLSRVSLAEREAEGTLAQIAAHLENCVRCTEVVNECKAARQEFFAGEPSGAATASLRAARLIVAEVAVRKAQRKRRWLAWLLPVSLVPAAAAVALMVYADRVGDRGNTVAMQTPSERESASGVRSKSSGRLALTVFCKRGEQIFEVNEGADFFEGDRLRFAYTKAESGFLLVFGVDDAGRVFPYYRDDTLASMAARGGSQVMLPGSVELDSHHGWERLFAVWSDGPLSDAEVRAGVAAAFADAGRDVRQMTDVAIGQDRISYLLRRP